MRKSWLIALALCALTLLLLAPVAFWEWRGPALPGASLANSTRKTVERVPAYVRSLRPEYPYSVIPGGAYTADELRRANLKDSVVRAHYADFNLKNAWVVKLTSDRYEYASYRLKNQIYWTGKRLRIPQGEALLTDGVNFARARCGNRLSEQQPQGQISSLEPPASLLSPPEFRPGVASNLDLGEKTPPLSVEAQTPIEESTQLAPSLAPEAETPMALAQSQSFEGAPGARSPLVVAPPSSFLLPGIPTGGGSSPTPPRGTLALPPNSLPPDGTLIPPAVPAPVPEPASIYLFLITFAAVLWGLTRVMTAEEKRQPDKGPSSFSDDLD